MRTVEDLEKMWRETNNPIYKFAKVIRKTLDMDLPVLIAVTGRMGRGKSTFTFHLADALLGDRFSLDRHLVFTREEFRQRIKEIEKYSVLIFDEGVGAHKRKSMEKQQIEIVEIMNKIRVYRTVVIFNVPSLWSLDRGIREHIVFWVYIPHRGEALVIPRPENPLEDDPWDMLRGWARSAIQEEILGSLKAGDLPNFNAIADQVLSALAAMRVRFGAYSREDVWQRYLELSERAKKQIDEEDEDLLPLSVVATLLGLSTRTVKMLLAKSIELEKQGARDVPFITYKLRGSQVLLSLPTVEAFLEWYKSQEGL